MNVQDLLLPIRNLMVWTFETLLEGSLATFLNVGIIVLIVITLLGWLKMQRDFTRKAQSEGSII